MAEISGKDIRAKVRESVKARSAELEKSGGAIPESEETRAFVASATPTDDDGSGSAEAPEAPAETPEAPEVAPLDGSSGKDTATAEAVAASSDIPVSTPIDTGASAAEEEWEDAEIDDDTLGAKYRYRAPKGQAEFIRKGWERQADYSRKTARLAEFQNEFLPMIESGQMRDVIPVYRMIQNDPVMANAVAHIYQQRLTNQPITYVQPGFEQHLQSQQQQPIAQPQQQFQPDPTLIDDPYFRDQMQPVFQQMTALQQQIAQQQQRIDAQNQAAEQQRAQQQQAYQDQQRQQQEIAQAHQQLVAMYPGEFVGGQADFPKLQQLLQYSARASLQGPYRLLEAKRMIDANTPRATAPAQSAAANSVAAAQAQAQEAARRARAEVAAGTVVSGGEQAPKPVKTRPPKTHDANGKPLPPGQAVRNIVAARNREAANS